MSGKMHINPGSPNDANRHYLPEEIKGSDMVINENGNNSLPYPELLKECHEQVLDEQQDCWYEYVPANYDGKQKVPLVISLHGGMMTGWGQATYSVWTLVADREGFIVVFPDASKERFWVVELDKKILEILGKPNPEGFNLQIPPEDPADNRDLNYLLALIEKMKQKYNIDEGRIFMQGMSMGDMMTSQFARYHGQVLAGQAGSGGPTHLEALFSPEGILNNRGGALAIWQSRLELDQPPAEIQDHAQSLVTRNRDYWRTVNGCSSLPEIKITGEDNLAFFTGERADLVFRDVKNRDHGQTLDDAELVWDYLFSGIRRDESGQIVRLEPVEPRRGDAYAIALAAGKAHAYVNSQRVDLTGPVIKHQKLKYHGLNGGAIVRGEYFMAPVSFVAKTFGATLTAAGDGLSCEMILPDGRTLQFARGSIGCVLDNKVQAMLCEAVYRDNELYIPIEWFCRRLFDNHVSSCGDVVYITDHYAELSTNMAQLIRDEIL